MRNEECRILYRASQKWDAEKRGFSFFISVCLRPTRILYGSEMQNKNSYAAFINQKQG